MNLRVGRLPRLVGHIQPRRRVRVVERVGDVLVDLVVAVGGVEPQLVLDERAAAVGIEIPRALQAVHRRQPLIDVGLRQVAGGEILLRPERGDVPVERVAAFLGNRVHPDARVLRLGVAAIRADADLLHAAFVHVEGDGLATRGSTAIRHAVDRAIGFRDAAAVHREAARRRAVDVLTADDARDRLCEALNLPVVRQALDHLFVVDGGARRALHVDERRFTGHGDRFVQLADLHVRVDGRDEVGAQVEVLDLDGVEAGKRERDRVGARPEIDDAIQTGGIGGDRAHALDEGRACRFHGHAGQDCTGRVLDDTGQRAL